LKLKLKKGCTDVKYYIEKVNFVNGEVSGHYYIAGHTDTWKYSVNFLPGQQFKLGKGGGVRVHALTMIEPFGKSGGTENSVYYEYYQGVTPNLPPTYTSYVLGLYPQNKGFDFFAGGPAVTYKMTSAYFMANNTVSKYHFITPMDLPVQIGAGQPGADGANFSVKIRDMSALWGAMWKKQDYGSDGVVKEEKTLWAYNADMNDGKTQTIQEYDYEGASTPPVEALTSNYVKDANNRPYVYFPFTAESPIKLLFGNPSDSWRNYFGTQQSLFSLRYFAVDCATTSSSGDALQACVDANGRSTQIVMQRFMPHPFQQTVKQDGLQTSTWQYYYDFLTGSPLKNRLENSDGSIVVTQTLPAYQDYQPMLLDHQFTQSKGLIKYAHAADKPFTGDSIDAAIVSASITRWRPVGAFEIQNGDSHMFTTPQAFRPYETMAWNNSIMNFKNPMDNCMYFTYAGVIDPNYFFCNEASPSDFASWISKGKNVRHDIYGHVTESTDPRGVPTGQLFGYGNSLPVAVGINAVQSDLFYSGFEIEPEATCKFVGGNCKTGTPGSYTNFQTLGTFVRAGMKAMQVKNTDSKDVCFQLDPVSKDKIYVASVWYYDETSGAMPTSTTATRPGITLGQPGVCQVELFPNGKNAQTPPAAGYPGYNERATGSGKWKRMEVRLGTCGAEFDPAKARVCLSASAGNTGLPVLYDELRVQPSNAQMSTYSYNAMGKMISVSDANETVTRFEYDMFGNMTGKRNDDGTLLTEQGKHYGKQ
jgi:YD repeat-containing protein